MTDDTPYRSTLAPRNVRLAAPVGRTARFVDAVLKAKGEAFVKSWLSDAICRFEDCVVWTNETARLRINREARKLILQHRIVIRVDAESTALLQNIPGVGFRMKKYKRGR